MSDGACGSAALCGNLEDAADTTCDGYELGRRGRCTYKTCAGDGCNVVGGFDLGADDAAAAARRATVVAGAFVAAAAWFFVAA